MTDSPDSQLIDAHLLLFKKLAKNTEDDTGVPSPSMPVGGAASNPPERGTKWKNKLDEHFRSMFPKE